MDKVILNNGTSLDVESIAVLTNGLALTFTNQTVDNLDSLFTPSNISEIKFVTSDGNVYADYKNLSYISILKIAATGEIIVTLAMADTTQQQINDLRSQVAEMLLALAEGGII
ncbi:MAG: hypothetical protein K0R54_2120 [Clostridiaceae bacterium]|jgi:hypothetical protein|nr:hypothetical protein [Clostridiaceae bacterium]